MIMIPITLNVDAIAIVNRKKLALFMLTIFGDMAKHTAEYHKVSNDGHMSEEMEHSGGVTGLNAIVELKIHIGHIHNFDVEGSTIKGIPKKTSSVLDTPIPKSHHDPIAHVAIAENDGNGLVIVAFGLVMTGEITLSIVMLDSGHYPKLREAALGDAMTSEGKPITFVGNAIAKVSPERKLNNDEGIIHHIPIPDINGGSSTYVTCMILSKMTNSLDHTLICNGHDPIGRHLDKMST